MKPAMVVNTCRDPLRLGKVLDSLIGQSHLLSDLIVSEDGEDRETASVIEARAARLRCPLRHLSAPWSGQRVCEVRNRALRLVTAEYVILLDGDCVAHPRFVEDHTGLRRPGYFLQGTRAAVKERFVPGFTHRAPVRWFYFLSGRITGRKDAWRRKARLDFDQDHRIAFCCNQSYWTSDLRNANGFDNDIVGWGADDYDLAGRIGLAGIRPLCVRGRAILFHLDHPRGDATRTRDNFSYADDQRTRGIVRCRNGILETGAVRLRVLN